MVKLEGTRRNHLAVQPLNHPGDRFPFCGCGSSTTKVHSFHLPNPLASSLPRPQRTVRCSDGGDAIAAYHTAEEVEPLYGAPETHQVLYAKFFQKEVMDQQKASVMLLHKHHAPWKELRSPDDPVFLNRF